MSKVFFKKNANSTFSFSKKSFVFDNRISLKSKGLMLAIMSMPADWEFSIEELMSVTNEGKSALYSAIKELRTNGYCSILSIHDKKGKIAGNDYYFYEKPHTEKPHTEKPHTENRDADEMPINKGSLEDESQGVEENLEEKKPKELEIKETPPNPPNKENSPTPPKEIIPPISPKENTEKRAKFKKPTIEEVRAYIFEKNYNIDAEAFWCYYEANGWVQGRAQKPIKNWKACVTTWHKNSKNYGTNQQSNPQASPNDVELLGQTHRIMQEFRAERLASQG